MDLPLLLLSEKPHLALKGWWHEDAALAPLPKEQQHRRKVRRWRQSMTTEQHQVWASMGLMGEDLRGLVPFDFNQTMEAQIVATMPGGPAEYTHELIFIERPLPNGWIATPARLERHRQGNSLGIDAYLAQELGLQAGATANFSIAGRLFTAPIAIHAIPEQKQLEQEAADSAAELGIELDNAAVEQAAEQLATDYARVVWLPVHVLLLLAAQGISVRQGMFS